MKRFKKVVILLALLIIYSYMLSIENIPENVVVFEGESLDFKTMLGLKVDFNKSDETISTSTSIGNEVTDQVGTAKLKVNLFDKFCVKDVNVNVIPKTTVIPVGDIAGVKLYASGVLVVGMSDVKGEKPYEKTDIKEGDMIVSINDKNITCTTDLIETVNQSNGKEMNLKYVRDGETQECSMKPVATEGKEYKLGLWVRDSAAGVGTVTFYEPSTKSFGALGHGITDMDTDQLLDIAKGEFITTKVLSIIKGEKGTPGRIQGTVENQKNIGEIDKNTKFGIYGKVNHLSALEVDPTQEKEVAMREEIKTGKATILCSLDKKAVQEYEIEIEKIYLNNDYDNKSMLIKVTDQNLLSKTGGIIQGMSGSPVLQNGKFIGAVTHVLVNDPKQGYAIFGDLMIKQMREAS